MVNNGFGVGDPDATEPTAPKSIEDKPQEPAADAGWDAWFNYYDDMHLKRYKCTFGDVALKTGYSEGYTRQQHAAWLCRHGNRGENT